MKQLFLLFSGFERLVQFVMILLLSGMVCLIFAQVVFRYLLNHPLTWTEELSRHFMIWAAFLGAAIAYRKKAHLGVDVLVLQFSPRWQGVVVCFVHLVSILFAGFLVYYGIAIVQKTMHQLSSALGIPMGYIYASIPVGAAIILLFAIEKLLERYVQTDNGSVSGAADPPS